MGVFDWLGGKKNPTSTPVEVVENTRSLTYDVPQKVFIERDGPGTNDLDYFFDQHRIANVINGYYAESNFIELFYCLPEIASAVNEIASRVADATWLLCKDWNDEVDYSNQHFNNLFEQPNPLLTMRQHVYQAVCYEILTGKEYFFFNIPSTLPIELSSVLSWCNLPSHRTIVNTHPNVNVYTATSITDIVSSYMVNEGQVSRQFDARNVLPHVNTSLYDPNNIKKCASPLLGADKAIKNLIPVYEARGAVYIKRGAMGFVVSKKSDESGLITLKASEKKEIQDDFQRSKGILGDKAPIVVTSVPVDFVKTSMSIAEMQPFEETLADAVVIYRVLGIPRHLVPSKDTSTYSNAKADMITFYDEQIIPRADKLAQKWTEYLNLRKINRRYIKASYQGKAVLQENKKEKAQADKINGDTFLQAFTGGVTTLNEWIIHRGGKKSSNPLYDKRTLEMTPDEIEQVKNAYNLKTTSSGNTEQTTGSENQPITADGSAN